MKMMSIRLAMPLLGILLWVMSIHAGTFGENILPLPLTGFGKPTHIKPPEPQIYISPKVMTDIKHVKKDINSSISFANMIINSSQRLENNLAYSKIHVREGTPSHGMFVSFAPEWEAVRRGKDALVAIKATVQLLNIFCYKHNLEYHECSKLAPFFKFHNTPLQASCDSLRKVCTPEEYLYSYRSVDGTCNHISNGALGESFTGYSRLLPADYKDGVYQLKSSVLKGALPSPRLITTKCGTKNLEEKEHKITLAVMQWAQFIEHDLSRTATSIMVHSDKTIECCESSGNKLSPRYIHPFCNPISVPSDDKFYSEHNVNCMTYVRSIPVMRSDCSLGPIQQLNQATHYLDASQIYGTTFRKSVELRSFQDGKLQVSHNKEKTFLPHSDKPSTDCELSFTNASCYKSGDTRVNFQPQLTAMYTLWYREHNRIAGELANLNQHWDDEIIFQETRRIVIAEMQRITYKEWLRAVLGEKYLKKIDKFSEYNQDQNPSVSNSFATAAMRSLKTLIDGKINLYDENRNVNSSFYLENYYRKPEIIEEPGRLDAIIRGLATQNSRKYESEFANSLMNQLYKTGEFGFDMLSLDIQRGRDHGLPGYAAFRSLCGLPVAKKFTDFEDVMTKDQIDNLAKVYSHPQDVDLIVGGLMEKSNDNLLGPTFSCIIADQMLRTRSGDRFFYTNEHQPKPFTKSQLTDIDNVSLARIFCDNSDGISFMQPNVFESISSSNNLVPCTDIPRLNLELWREAKYNDFLQ